MPRGVVAVSVALGGEDEPEEVAPAFAHLLGVAEAGDVRRAAGQAVADAVAVLVGHHQVVEGAVDIGSGKCADELLHARARPSGGVEKLAPLVPEPSWASA